MGYQFRSLSYKFAEEGKFPRMKRGNINYWRSPESYTMCLDACAEMLTEE